MHHEQSLSAPGRALGHSISDPVRRTRCHARLPDGQAGSGGRTGNRAPGELGWTAEERGSILLQQCLRCMAGGGAGRPPLVHRCPYAPGPTPGGAGYKLKSLIKITFYLVVLSVVLVLAAAGWGCCALQTAPGRPLRIRVADTRGVRPGSTPASGFAGLGNRGVIERAAGGRRYWQWRMPDTILQVGEYRLEPGMQVRG